MMWQVTDDGSTCLYMGGGSGYIRSDRRDGSNSMGLFYSSDLPLEDEEGRFVGNVTITWLGVSVV